MSNTLLNRATCPTNKCFRKRGRVNPVMTFPAVDPNNVCLNLHRNMTVSLTLDNMPDSSIPVISKFNSDHLPC